MTFQIYIWQLKDNTLSGVAFIDTQIYIHSMVSLKNMVVIADILKGITLLRYQPDMRVLSVVSRVGAIIPVHVHWSLVREHLNSMQAR